MAATSPHQAAVAGAMHDRLDQLDQAIALLKTVRKETASLASGFFPEGI